MKRAWVFVALVMGLMVVAATYAAWTETLNVSGSAATGELDVAFTGYSVSDNDDESGYVGTADTLVSLNDTDGDGDYDVAEITVSNAYPGYQATVDLDVSNVGTIAAKISDITVNNPSELTVTTSGVNVGDIIDRGGTKTLTLTITVNDDAQENGNYAFTVTIDATQFNAE